MTDSPIPEPRENPDLFGHEAAEKILLKSFNSGQMPHAWLISGLRGIGKATLAFRFARFILSKGRTTEPETPALFDLPPESGPTGILYVSPDTPVSRRIAAGGHADLMTVERTMDERKDKKRSGIVVESVRGITSFLSMTSAEGGWRVVIIDSADDMNTNAANAVLKVLEEPPERALLLLVSHSPGRLLPTIRSRCRNLPLRPLTPETLSMLLAKRRPQLSEEEIIPLLNLSDGSIGHGLVLADEGGVDLYNDLIRILETLPNLDVRQLHAIGDKVGGVGKEESFATMMDLLSGWLGRMILLGAGASTPGDQKNLTSEHALMKRLLTMLSLDRWLELWEKISRLPERTRAINLDRRQVFLNAFLALENALRP